MSTFLHAIFHSCNASPTGTRESSFPCAVDRGTVIVSALSGARCAQGTPGLPHPAHRRTLVSVGHVSGRLYSRQYSQSKCDPNGDAECPSLRVSLEVRCTSEPHVCCAPCESKVRQRQTGSDMYSMRRVYRVRIKQIEEKRTVIRTRSPITAM